MARDELTVERYLAEVAGRLAGPAAWRADVLAELRDGVYTALDSRVRAGEPASHAAQAVLAEFGAPRTVAAGFAGEAAAVRARRVAGRLLASGPLAGASWLAVLVTGGVPLGPELVDGPWRLMPAIGAVLAIVLPAALFAVAATGRSLPRFAGRPGAAVTAATAAAGCCAAGDVLMLGMFAAWAGAGAPVVWPVAGCALAVSVTRCVSALWAVRGLRARSA